MIAVDAEVVGSFVRLSRRQSRRHLPTSQRVRLSVSQFFVGGGGGGGGTGRRRTARHVGE